MNGRKPLNPVACALRTPRFKKRLVRSRKLYRRKNRRADDG